ncbi:hypothetical protein E3N88_04724 [Mikania micrantha]|uniref:NAD(P)-binding domain-containing protein n=1 Tax=Mikania micrantha TaxID=192012 RepID=A0A5N6PX28_9ASTR|nr:hypothetical protein E3N88_04724 [Mikania micrantha]
MQMQGSHRPGPNIIVDAEKKKTFVSGATEKTGKRIVEQLLAKCFAVKAGACDAEKAKTTFPNLNQDLQFVKADVIDGIKKSATAMGDDSNVVICATGFEYSWDFLASWKYVSNASRMTDVLELKPIRKWKSKERVTRRRGRDNK